MKKFLLIIILILAVSSKAEACYNSDEFEAEQILRIHSELMVIGLTCLKMPNGAQTYRKYKRFTDKNSLLISKSEAILIKYYIKERVNNPEQKLHSLRTKIANKISEKAIRMSMLSFCQKFSSRLDKALNMNENNIIKWANNLGKFGVSSESICSKK